MNDRELQRSPVHSAFVLLVAGLVVSGCAARGRTLLPNAAAPLPLGDPALPERRVETVLAPGLTLTRITRGVPASDGWTLTVRDRGPEKPPGPGALATREQAADLARRLKAAGIEAVLREERQPGYADLPAGSLGFVVRAGKYASREAAGSDVARLSALGYRATPVFTGDDGDAASSGPWAVDVLTIDPRLFRGEIAATHGRTVSGRATTTARAREAAATVAVNAGFFVMTPNAGVPGEPAGLFVEHGKVLSEATNGRVAMGIFRRGLGGRTSVRFEEYRTSLSLATAKGARHVVDGVNRKPGVIRNCGGTGDTPTDLPRHDVTCTDPDEIVVITPEFGAAAPDGEGVEAVVDGAGTVVETRGRAGGAVPAGGMLVQATGSEAAWLRANAPIGATLRFDVRVLDGNGRRVRLGPLDSAVNAGPRLVAAGKPAIRPVADGLVHPDDASFFLGWGVHRNPRTMAGVDRRGRILLVTVDGKQPEHSIGLTLVEGARLMAALGARDAVNLDGGGSTAMVVNGALVGRPSDPGGERAVGDVIVVKAK